MKDYPDRNDDGVYSGTIWDWRSDSDEEPIKRTVYFLVWYGEIILV